jgi:Tfp pilus assembly protein PilX
MKHKKLEQHKRSALRRKRDEGAVIFIVATTLALLAGMGVYALTSTTAEVRTAGYQRQATQAHYITDLATVAAVEVFSPENASYIDNQMKVSTSAKPCLSGPQVGLNSGVSEIAKRCAKLHPDYVTQSLGAPALVNQTIQGTEIRGDFWSEVTEPISNGMQAGFDLSNGKCFTRYTVTTYVTTSNNTTAVPLGRETSRARVVVGPFDCGG